VPRQTSTVYQAADGVAGLAWLLGLGEGPALVSCAGAVVDGGLGAGAAGVGVGQALA
jgi:hypothetical protein